MKLKRGFIYYAASMFLIAQFKKKTYLCLTIIDKKTAMLGSTRGFFRKQSSWKEGEKSACYVASLNVINIMCISEDEDTTLCNLGEGGSQQRCSCTTNSSDDFI